jgi:hypothetical protein
LPHLELVEEKKRGTTVRFWSFQIIKKKKKRRIFILTGEVSPMACLVRTATRLRPLTVRSVNPLVSTSRKTTFLLVSTQLQRSIATVPARSQTAAATPMSDKLDMEQPYFADEPLRPTVLTEIPGPESKRAIGDLEKLFDTRSLNMLGNYQKSFGN